VPRAAGARAGEHEVGVARARGGAIPREVAVEPLLPTGPAVLLNRVVGATRLLRGERWAPCSALPSRAGATAGCTAPSRAGRARGGGFRCRFRRATAERQKHRYGERRPEQQRSLRHLVPRQASSRTSSIHTACAPIVSPPSGRPPSSSSVPLGCAVSSSIPQLRAVPSRNHRSAPMVPPREGAYDEQAEHPHAPLAHAMRIEVTALDCQ